MQNELLTMEQEKTALREELFRVERDKIDVDTEKSGRLHQLLYRAKNSVMID